MPQLAGIPDFVHVAEHKSFRGAARILGVTPTAVSKAVSRLEERLGARLLNRTSRHVSLTPEGEVYLRHCRDALDQLQAGEDLLSRTREEAEGSVSVSLSFVLGRPVVAALPAFAARHPKVSIRLSFTDRDVSLAEEDVDVAVRIGALADSGLIARRLPSPRWVTVAAPAYLARAGAPRAPAELAGHSCLRFARPAGGVADWRFLGPGAGSEEVVSQRVDGAVVMDHGELLVDAAVRGLGVAQVFDFMVGELIRSGALLEVLGEWAAPGPPVHALTLPGRHAVPKVRAVLDLLARALVPISGGRAS